MTSSLFFGYKPVLFSIEKKDGFTNEVEITIDEGEDFTKLYFTREQIFTLTNKLRYFLKKNYELTNGNKEEMEDVCFITKIPKTQYASTVSEMKKFLHTMTKADVGFYKKESKMDSLFHGNGDSTKATDTFMTSVQENG